MIYGESNLLSKIFIEFELEWCELIGHFLRVLIGFMT